ncbi:sensor histidine kinase [Sutcliffiella halmapala]|uniref:sensor histidine kinase n=1 Tax=Sutcliffiella halmapala TaxID=79882 RepID=UPI000995B0AA|nr:HAMP domain-containing sensor histidine kinase [Sutcliffiella halmapala]
MSIKKRLILSNIAMIVIPIFIFFMLEIFLGILIFHIFGGNMEERDLNMFLTIRFIILLLALMITNGALTYFVSKSIIKPVQQLTKAAKEISEGNLDSPIQALKEDELGQLSNTFDAMRLKLKEARELQRHYEDNRKELIASISHDLKTPITSIKGYVKGIQDGIANTPEKRMRYMDTIYKKANDMDHLIDELFLYSKLDLGRVPFEWEEVDLNAYFQDFIEELSFSLEEDGGKVSYHADQKDSYIVMADREKLKRVISNIMQNSLKYMNKSQREIHVFLKAESDQVCVQIKDNGQGIPAEALPYIFESFYRTDLSRNSATGGSGLGLAIGKRIIEEHGGSIWAESELGKGTSIFFTLKKRIRQR